MLRRLPWLLVLLALGAAVWLLREEVWPSADPLFGDARDENGEAHGDGRTGGGSAGDAIEDAWDEAVRLAGARDARAWQPGEADDSDGEGKAAAKPTSSGAVVRFGGLVLGPDGRPAAGITVKLEGVGGGGLTVETEPSGRFSLEVPAGRYHLLLSGEGVGGLRLPHYLIDGAKGGDLEFTLKQAVTYEVSVKRETEGVENAEVSLVPTAGPGGEAQQTDVMGIAVFEQVVAGNYTLRVELPSGESVWRQVRLARDDALKIDMPPVVRVHGVVENKDEGGTVEGALVRMIVRGPSNTAITVTTTSESDGRFELGVPRGNPIRFEAVADGFAPWPHRKAIRKTLKLVYGVAKGREVEVRIPLERGLVLAGTVADPDGKPAAGIALKLQPRRGLALDGTSDEEGRYEIPGVRPERYTLVVTSEGWFTEGAPTVRIPKTLSPGEVYAYDVTVHPTITAEGIVVHADQKPAAAVRVWITAQGRLLKAAHNVGRVLETFTDANGRWRVTDLPPMQAVKVRASLGSLEATPRTIRTNALPTLPIKLKLAPTVQVKGTVMDIASRTPIKGVQVQIGPEGKPGGRTGHRAYTDAEGTFVVQDMIPGGWVFTPSRKGYLKAEGERIELAKTDGEKTVTLYLDPGLTIGGVVLDLQGNALKNAWARVTGTKDDGERVNVRVRTDARGVFAITGLESGAYVLMVWRSSFKARTIKNLRGGESRLTIELTSRS